MKYEIIKKRMKELSISFVIFIVFLKIIFFKTSIILLLKGTVMFYLTYLIPGLLLTYILFKDMYILERYAVAILLGFIVVGILSYYTGIFFNLHIKIFHYIVPPLVILVEAGILLIKKKNNSSISS